MPEEGYWETFFDADCIVRKLECAKEGKETIAEFGSGFGTFTLPVARLTSGIVHAIDIDPELVDLVQHKANMAGLPNVRVELRDFVANGSGLPSESVDHAMVYNLLHLEDPIRLLQEAFRIVRRGGALSIVHWKFDPATPRGPSMDIRPRPEQCRSWAEAAGFTFVRYVELSVCCDYHYGLLLTRA